MNGYIVKTLSTVWCKVFDELSLDFIKRYCHYKIPRGIPSAGMLSTQRWEMCDFRLKSPFMSAYPRTVSTAVLFCPYLSL